MNLIPPLTEREDFDLILIAKNDNHSWRPEVSLLALAELKNRGITQLKVDEIYLEILENGKRAYELIIANRKTEDYPLFEKIYKCIWWPKTLLFDWDLKTHGYDLMAKRRYQLIGLGILIWISLFAYIGVDANKREQALIDKINKVDNSKWEERILRNTKEDSL